MTDYEKNAAVSKQIHEKNFDVINIRLWTNSSLVLPRKWHSKIIQFLMAGGSGRGDRNTDFFLTRLCSFLTALQSSLPFFQTAKYTARHCFYAPYAKNTWRR